MATRASRRTQGTAAVKVEQTEDEVRHHIEMLVHLGLRPKKRCERWRAEELRRVASMFGVATTDARGKNRFKRTICGDLQRNDRIKLQPDTADFDQFKSEKPSKPVPKVEVEESTPAAAAKEPYFAPGVQMTDVHKSYCRCVAHLSAKQTDDCLHRLHGGYRPKKGDPGRCYNPYAVCTASTKRRGPGSGECLQHYDLDDIPEDERRAMAILKTGSEDSSILYERQAVVRAKQAQKQEEEQFLPEE